jgi:hypothetical protein
MENLNDIFNLSLDNFKEPEKKGGTIFKPDANAGKEGVYKAVVRFLPWHKDVKKSVMKKWSCWMTDPGTNESKMVDCPSTVGRKSVLQDLFWKFKKSDSVAEQRLADNFSRRQRFASLVQIIKDDNNPENVGRIMVWPYGVKIYNKIQAEMKPEFGQPHIPFDLFEAKPFLVHITKVAGYNNYDNCRFLDEKIPVMIEGAKMTKTQDDLNKIREWLDSESPDLGMYDFQEWDTATEDFVQSVIRNTVPGGAHIASAETKNRAQTPSSPVVSEDEDILSSMSAKPSSNVPKIDSGVSAAMDDLDLGANDSGFDDELYSML